MEKQTDAEWLIYSREHNAWWKPNSRGYTPLMNKAGRYSHLDAIRIVSDANRGVAEDNLQEFMVRAPEAYAALVAALKPFAAMAAYYEAEIANTCPPGEYYLNAHDPDSATAEHAIAARDLLLKLAEGER